MNAQRPNPAAFPSSASSAAGATPRSGVRVRPPDGWLALGLAGSLVLTGAACRELLRFQQSAHVNASLSGEVDEWFFEPSDSSPIVVLLLCAWLLWRRRRRLAVLWGRRGPRAWTAALWLAAAGLFAWAIRSGAPDLQAVALVPALLGAGNLLGGKAAMRVMAVPAAVLLFAVPLPAPLLNQIVWRLQIWTADFTGVLLQLLGLPTLVSGDRIILSDGVFMIIETCSGLRSIETLALLSILMVDLFGRRGRHAVALLLASPLVAFLINGLRCLGLIFNPHADVASIHSLQGIAMLLGGVLLLYFIDGLLARAWPPPAPISAIERIARQEPARPLPLALRVAAQAGFAGLLLALSWLPRFATPPLATHTPAEILERSIDGWEASDERNDWMFLGTTGFGRFVNRRYTKGRDAVDVFLGQADPSARLRSYLSPKVAYPDSGWIVESEERSRIAGREATLRVLRKGATRMLVAHWFEASPGVAAESVRALFALDATPMLRSRIPTAVRLSTPLLSAHSGALERSRDRLERFAERLAPVLQQLVTPREA